MCLDTIQPLLVLSKIVSILNDAGWSPIDKTKTHIEVERDLNRLKYQNSRSPQLDLELQELYSKHDGLKIYGWKVNETNLHFYPMMPSSS